MILLLRQALLFARAPELARWRLETFGLYMPSLPGSRKWWRVNVRVLGLLVQQMPAYIHWLRQMELLRRR